MEDLIEQANEIQESLGRSYGVPDEVDEADLQAGESACPASFIRNTDDKRVTYADRISHRARRFRSRR